MKNTIFKSFKFTFFIDAYGYAMSIFLYYTNAASVKDIPVKKQYLQILPGMEKRIKFLSQLLWTMISA